MAGVLRQDLWATTMPGGQTGRPELERALRTSRITPTVIRMRPVRARRRRRGGVAPLLALLVCGGLVAVTWGRVQAVRGEQRIALAPAVTSVATPPAPTSTPGAALAALAPLIAAAATATPTDTPTAEAPTSTPTPAPTSTATPVPAYYSTTWLQAHPPTTKPTISAKAAYVVDYDTRQVLYEQDEHEHLHQASTTKITLMDVALDVASPDKPIKVQKDATEVEPDHMGIQTGEILTLQELMYGALLDSGNDAGWAIAEGVGGLDHTVALMNARVVALGLHDTHFANPVGFDDPNHYTSAADLAVLTADALTRHPLIKQIVSTKKTIIESTKTHGWFGPINLNNLLWDYPGAWGVKPGWTSEANYCLVAAATRDGHTVLVTLLDSQDHFADGTTLLNYGFQRIAQEDQKGTGH